MSEQILKDHLEDTIEAFRSYKKLAEKALDQISDEEFFRQIDEESNSVAAVAKHIGGNLRSRWTDFLTTDGEKPDRNRDTEFVAEGDSRASITELWDRGWNALVETLESLTVEDLGKIIQIRGEDYTVLKAMNRALAHTASHIGQIVFLAKHYRSAEWQTLSVPRNKSGEFNSYLAENKGKAHYMDSTAEFSKKNQ